MDAKMFGAFLAQVRRAQGLTQAELAEQLHVTDKAVSRWERGVGLPDINTLEPLADALGLSLADLMHCHDPAQEPPTAPVPLEDFFSMLRRRPVADWHSVRTALLRLSIALALWGIFACHGTLAVHWRSLSDGSLQADGWMSSWVVFPLLAGMEFLMLELWNSFEQSVFYHRYLETVVLLSKGEIDSKKVRVEFSLEDMDMSGFQKGATYEQIKAYVLEHTGLEVSSLYISQIKRKCGLDVGQNYNLSKKEDAKVPKCPPEKEAAIRDALKYFQMI